MSANAATIAGVSGSPSTLTPRATATAGFTYVITVALAGPTSAISRKNTTNATAVQSTPSAASEPSTAAGAYTTVAAARQTAVIPRPGRSPSFRFAISGLGGVALLAGPHLTGGSAWPIAEVMLVALCYATGPLIAGRRLGDLPGLGMTAVCLAGATVVYAPAAALTWPQRLPSAAVLGSLAALGVLCTALAFVLFFRLIAEVGPARATVITYVNPAVAVALGVSVLGEPLTPAIVAAFALILSGSVLATRSGRSARRPAPRFRSADRPAVPD